MTEEELRSLSPEDLTEGLQQATARAAALNRRVAHYSDLLLVMLGLSGIILVGWPLLWGVTIWMILAAGVTGTAGVYALIRGMWVARTSLFNAEAELQLYEDEQERRS